MSPHTNIAILIKHPWLFDPACRCAQALTATGAKVVLYYLCADRPDEDHKTQLSRLKRLTPATTCYLDDPQLAARYDLNCISMDDLAEKLKNIDRVLPF